MQESLFDNTLSNTIESAISQFTHPFIRQLSIYLASTSYASRREQEKKTQEIGGRKLKVSVGLLMDWNWIRNVIAP